MRVFLIGTALICIFLNPFFSPDLFGASPAIRFQEDVFNFQPILEGESIDINFEFSNEGGGILVIHDAVTSCGCTTAEYPTHPLEGGESGKIKTTFHSKGHAGDNDIRLLVKSNDPTVPAKTLYIRGRVIRQWQVQPGRFILTNLKPNRRYSRRLQITNFMEKSLQIKELVAGNPHISLLSDPKRVAPKGDEVIDFEVSVKDINANGIAQSSIRIEVANAEMQSVDIPVLMKLK
jgi:hypothetical protein